MITLNLNEEGCNSYRTVSGRSGNNPSGEALDTIWHISVVADYFLSKVNPLWPIKG